jgi:hypothetical protein
MSEHILQEYIKKDEEFGDEHTGLFFCKICRKAEKELEDPCSGVHWLTKALYDRGFDVIPSDFKYFGITENDSPSTATIKVYKRFKCICGEEWKDHENGDEDNFHALGGCEKSGCGRFTMRKS